jgi:hypothetical protein
MPGPAGRAGLLLLLACALLAGPARADVVRARFPEGGTHAFLTLSAAAEGGTLADGEIVAVPRGDRVQSRLVWRFRDGSFQDEATVFEVRPLLRLISFKQVQRGPSFPADVEVSFSRQPGEYRIVRRERDKKEPEESKGTLELPADAYNGMMGTVLRNLPRGATGTGTMVVFTPRPRMVKMTMRPESEDAFMGGGLRRTATRFLIDLEVGGIAGIFATIAGKEPPDLRYWLTASDVPTFVKFEGPFFLNGPVWRIEIASPRWPRRGAAG